MTNSHLTYIHESMNRTPDSLLPLHPKDFLVLFALSAGERHGYGLVKDIEEQTNGVVKLDPSNLYRSVKRLIHEGLVEERVRDQSHQDGDERRRYYGITDFGMRVVTAEAERLRQLTDAAMARNLIRKGTA